MVPVDPEMYGLGMALGCLIKFWPVFAAIGAVVFGIYLLFQVGTGIATYPANSRHATETAVALDQLAADRENEYNHCIEETTRGLQQNPRDAEAFFRRGRCNEAVEWYHFRTKYADTELRNLLETALADYNSAIAIAPANTKYYVYKALVCERLGLKRDALEAYEVYINNPPPDTYPESKSAVWQRIHCHFA